MLAVYAAAPRPDDPLAALRIGSRPEPEVPAGHVAVTVRAASLNMHDLWTLRGVGLSADRFPMILGMDGAGTLDDGSPVVLHSMIRSAGWMGDEALDPGRTCLSGGYQGTFAERVVVPVANALPLPVELTFDEAACLGTAWLTAYRMLFVASGLRPGQTILVQGCSGGVSTALVRLGAAAGFRVVATGRSEAKRALARELGACVAVEPGARLPERVDGVFDSVGRATWPHSVRALVPGGVLVTCGATTGEPDRTELQHIFIKHLRIVGTTMGTRAELADLVRFCVSTGVRPVVGARLPMTDAREAFASMRDGDTRGKTVLVPPS
ncbi:zinc-binding dehydrogenase [Pseudonocardia nematodicida]|uniref:Zinc-binding dehydrogenase n=1 Tax=Pseudonocardia nematodicida TaxID=1206997 RepID=A0ABV1K5X4_9PSEU